MKVTIDVSEELLTYAQLLDTSVQAIANEAIQDFTEITLKARLESITERPQLLQTFV